MSSQFFEGAEKLLEVWFVSTNPDVCDRTTLRMIPEHELVSLLKLANCRIMSKVSSNQCDAYLLSESSMFVSDNRFILKTCGTTSLMYAVEPLISLAARYCNLDYVDNIFYSRKNFRRPDLQPAPHQQFEREVNMLDELFEGSAAYCLGRLNQDRWYLYTLDLPKYAPPDKPPPLLQDKPDQTLEILMSDLDSDVMSLFSVDCGRTAAAVTQASGIRDLMPADAIVDEYLFEPCGYSMNGLACDEDVYYTIHVTPENEFSYASLETNVPRADHLRILRKVLEVFKPGKFLVTCFENMAAMKSAAKADCFLDLELEGYRQTDYQMLKLSHYFLSYTHFTRLPS